ncbi:hypothetical protein EWB00_000450 [Schistosoma japonicum]|uniref:Uncharacterized protein n=1 Tax=Schistosoma japonicum TaxID=6182 RepID=A0A4Z2CKI2_SCHJA|nr:hypothetical protein EWB00_000450 [Schistosoma japonicum]
MLNQTLHSDSTPLLCASVCQFLRFAHLLERIRSTQTQGPRGSEAKKVQQQAQKWEPAQEEVPSPYTITADVEGSPKGIYQDYPPKDPISSRKSQMQLFAPNQWTEPDDYCC